MYRINEIGRNVLITVDEVIIKAAIDDDQDPKYIRNSIEVAEERYIVPVLGEAFYEDFIEAKNKVVTAGNKSDLLVLINASRAAAGKNAIEESELVIGTVVNAIEFTSEVYQEFWNRFLWKVTAEAVDIVGIVPTWLRTTGLGQQLNSPQVLGGTTEGSASGGRRDVQYKADAMAQNRLNPMIERMKKWLCDKMAWYPLFDTCNCSKYTGISNRKGGIILGIYDDDDVKETYVPVLPGKAAPRTQECVIKVVIAAVPDESKEYMLCNLQTIPKEYPEGNTLTIPQLANKYISWPIFIDNEVCMDMDFDLATGTFDNTDNGGFQAGTKVTIKYIETL